MGDIPGFRPTVVSYLTAETAWSVVHWHVRTGIIPGVARPPHHGRWLCGYCQCWRPAGESTCRGCGASPQGGG